MRGSASSGTWRNDGTGALRVTATHVFLDTLQAAFERPTRYGGVLDLDATIRGTREKPQASGTLTIVERPGRARELSEAGRPLRLHRRNRSTSICGSTSRRASGSPRSASLPLGLFNADLPEQPIDVAIKSSTISLGLIEGVTDVVREGHRRAAGRREGHRHEPRSALRRIDRDRQRRVPGRRERRRPTRT